MKFVGEEYHAFSEMWVDITCLKCADSTDIRVSELNSLVAKINKMLHKKKSRNVKAKSNIK